MLKCLGVDWGEKRIGLAIGDDETRIASPFKVVSGINEVLSAVKAEEIDKIIVGAPYAKLSPEYRLPEKFEIFKKLLEEKVEIPVKYVDERLTSKAADALAGDNKTKAPRDAVAAMIILQSFLDKHE